MIALNIGKRLLFHPENLRIIGPSALGNEDLSIWNVDKLYRTIYGVTPLTLGPGVIPSGNSVRASRSTFPNKDNGGERRHLSYAHVVSTPEPAARALTMHSSLRGQGTCFRMLRKVYIFRKRNRTDWSLRLQASASLDGRRCDIERRALRAEHVDLDDPEPVWNPVNHCRCEPRRIPAAIFLTMGGGKAWDVDGKEWLSFFDLFGPRGRTCASRSSPRCPHPEGPSKTLHVLVASLQPFLESCSALVQSSGCLGLVARSSHFND